MRAQNKFGLRIKKIRIDNGTEFKNSQIEGFLEEEGIKHELSSPYTTQQNSVVERNNRTLLIFIPLTMSYLFHWVQMHISYFLCQS
jgi:transposase InsO family protein